MKALRDMGKKEDLISYADCINSANPPEGEDKISEQYPWAQVLQVCLQKRELWFSSNVCQQRNLSDVMLCVC